ncbi:uncharacterized [Tachysurus ichikawai]
MFIPLTWPADVLVTERLNEINDPGGAVYLSMQLTAVRTSGVITPSSPRPLSFSIRISELLRLLVCYTTSIMLILHNRSTFVAMETDYPVAEYL